MRARFLLMGYALSVLPAFALPITHVEPGLGSAGPLILVEKVTAVVQPATSPPIPCALPGFPEVCPGGQAPASVSGQRVYTHLLRGAAAVEDNLPPSVTPVHQKLAANSWIDREVNKQGERCCDAGKDCHVVPANRVMSRRDGVMLPDYGNVEIPGNQIQVSQDGQYWVCIWGGKVKCFHAPHSGS